MKRERAVKELYNEAKRITKPEITPVLKGIYRMQGPLDEMGCDFQTKTVPFQAGKKFDKLSMNRKGHLRAESGTCNVCSAPCSSCMHINQALLGSRTDESSVNEGDVFLAKTNRKCGRVEHTASEASNLQSATSSRDSFSENGESRAKLRASDISDVSDDAGIHSKLPFGVSAAEYQHPVQSRCVSDLGTLSNMDENARNIEGHGDNISCVSKFLGPEGLKKASNIPDAHFDVEQSDGSSHMQRKFADGFTERVLSGTPVRGEKGVGSSLREVRSPYTFSQNERRPTCTFVIGGDLSSHIQGKHPAPSEHPYLSLKKESACDMVSGKRSVANEYPDKTQSVKKGITGLPEVSNVKSPKLDSEADRVIQGLPDKALKCLDKSIKVEKSNEAIEFSGIQEATLQSPSGNDSEDSDIVEHDVKVCDICGDAGREYLLAICCRCSDGAEHIYCMRKKMDKIPEGEWLCEECKFVEETEKKQDFGIVNGDENNQEGSDSRKRHVDHIEIDLAAKRKALEPSTSSPKVDRPAKPAVLSRENLLKGLDKGKKPVHKPPLGTLPVDDDSKNVPFAATAPRFQSSRGTLLKSTSFGAINSKPKVKLVDDVPNKHKWVREQASNDLKEGPARMFNKSVSFKSANSGRFNSTESKVKMLPFQVSHPPVMMGLKKAKERNLFEKKHLSKLERPCSTVAGLTVSTTKAEQKLSSHGESALFLSNNQDAQAVHSDGKFTASLPPPSFVARKGEVKLQPSCSVGAIWASATNGGPSFAEQKSNQFISKDEPSSQYSQPSEKPCSNVAGIAQDILPPSRVSMIPGGKIGESSLLLSKQGAMPGGRSLLGQKFKEMSHATESYTFGSPQASVVDLMAAKISREGMNNGNKLKDAIHAAMLKKPGICRKNIASDQSDELPIPNTEMSFEIAPQDQLSVSRNTSNAVPADSHRERREVSPILSSHLAEASESLKAREPNTVSTVGGPSMRDWHLSTAISVLKMSIFPVLEYIWQGDLEIFRNTRVLDLRTGFQAHLSSCASPKVLEVANRFPNKIPMTEVPRLSTWPTQFTDTGVTEDNIALYFFAKDLESYGRNYKSLLDSMVKNDLALEGNVNGVELLVFPSNLLPKKSQCWNMLFYMWGVFRVQRGNNRDQKPISSQKPNIPRVGVMTSCNDIPSAVMSVPENLCSTKGINEVYSPCDRPCDDVISSGSLASSVMVNEYSDIKQSSCGQMSLAFLSKLDQPNSIVESDRTARVPPNTSLEHKNPELKAYFDFRPPVRETRTPEYSNEGKMVSTHHDASNDLEGTSSLKIHSPLQKLNYDESDERLGTSSWEVDSAIKIQEADPGSSGREKHRGGASEDAINSHNDSGAAEMFFFPVEANDLQLGASSTPHEDFSLRGEVPNLELALGADRKTRKREVPPARMLPGEKPSDEVTVKEEASASLSLSLSFPFQE